MDKSIPAAEAMAPYHFGDITLDPARRRVTRGRTPIRLGKLTYELLLLLVEAAPRVVMHEEVAETLWAGRPVTAETVRQRVKLLRKALSEDSSDPRYIRVIRGQGYRLIPDVTRLPLRTFSVPALKRQLLAATVLLALAVPLTVFYWQVLGSQDRSQRENPVSQRQPLEPSVAVLPFENLSPDPNDAYFVDGIHSDLLTQLAKIENLRVIARTSVEEYRNTQKSLRDISTELGVSAILEGSFQRSGEQIRINVQLIDAITDEHLWAELYDRVPTAENIFAMQSEMAEFIARALHAELSADGLARLNEIPTVSTKARNYFLLGESELRKPNNISAPASAAAAYERAVEEDPEFALAWAALGRAYCSLYYFVDRTEARRKQARAAIERALELSPDLPEAHLARGFYEYQVQGDFEAALRKWAEAERGMLGDPRVHMARAYVFRQTGELEKASMSIARAIDLDPRNLEHLAVQTSTLNRLHDYDKAEAYADRIIAVAPDSPVGYRSKARIALQRNGDGAAAQSTLDSPPFELDALDLRWTAALYQRDYERALRVLEESSVDIHSERGKYRPKSWYAGVTHDLAGRLETAGVHYRMAREQLERALLQDPDDPRVMVALAFIMAREEEQGPAVELAIRALELIPTTLPGPQRPVAHWDGILALVASGAYDTAVNEVDGYFSHPTEWSIEGRLQSPLLDPIRGDPRMRALVEKFRR